MQWQKTSNGSTVSLFLSLLSQWLYSNLFIINHNTFTLNIVACLKSVASANIVQIVKPFQRTSKKQNNIFSGVIKILDTLSLDDDENGDKYSYGTSTKFLCMHSITTIICIVLGNWTSIFCAISVAEGGRHYNALNFLDIFYIYCR